MLDLVKLQHFRNLVSLSVVDGDIDDAERAALAQIASERGIPADRLEVMLKRAHEYTYIVPQNSMDREKQLEEMIRFALVDGELAQAELDLIATVAEKLGFTDVEFRKILETHRASPEEKSQSNEQ